MAYRNGAKAPIHPGERGEHPVGGAVGAAAGAATAAVAVGAAEGAAMGTVAGLPGMAVGVAVGGIVGALVGKGAAQLINPTTEDAYWHDNYRNRSYFDSVIAYDSYAPAYRYGIEAYTLYSGQDFNDIEQRLAQGWENSRGLSPLTWESAKPATRDAYERLRNLND